MVGITPELYEGRSGRLFRASAFLLAAVGSVNGLLSGPVSVSDWIATLLGVAVVGIWAVSELRPSVEDALSAFASDHSLLVDGTLALFFLGWAAFILWTGSDERLYLATSLLVGGLGLYGLVSRLYGRTSSPSDH